MDDIYDNLENYNDVNLVEELRKEIMELKFTLEERDATLERLQKDFDRVSSEFKKMEINYSSLLKTAKAEVERKTQMIASLNSEKDMLVLNCLQNTNKSLLNIKRNLIRDNSRSKNSRWSDSSKTEPSRDKNKMTKDTQEMKKYDSDRDRGIENRMPSTDTTSSVNTEDTSRLINIETKSRVDPYSDKNSDSKEVKPNSQPQSIRNRRKSLPALGQHFLKLSSDEEFEALYSAEENRRKEWPSNEGNNRWGLDKNYDKHKLSETSGIDDKYSSNHESSRDTYCRGKQSRYSDRYRSTRDRYDTNQRYRRHFSPDMRRRAPRDLSGDRYQRTDYERRRVLESPPTERLDPRKNRDRRANYEKIPYNEKVRSQQERQSIKHKAQSDFEEPSGKRARIDSSSRWTDEDLRWPKDSPAEPRPPLMKHQPHMSCQSPDYVHMETMQHPIKEIRHTAITKLNDPRKTSMKYIMKTDGNKVSLSTVAAQNIRVQNIDKKAWNISIVELPEALKEPPQPVDQLVEDLNMDFENPVSNLSMESGEILSDTPIADVPTKKILTAYDNARVSESVSKESKDTQQATLVTDKIQQDPLKATKYKIPKIKKVQEQTVSQSIVDDPSNPLGMLLKELKSKCEETKTSGDSKGRGNDDGPRETKEIAAVVEIDKIPEKSVEDKPQDSLKLSISLRKLKSQPTLSSAEIVAGDLELSDETCDDSEMQVSRRKVPLERKKRSRVSNEKCQESNSLKNDSNTKDEVKTPSSAEKVAEMSPETSKKLKTKRKSRNQKRSSSKDVSDSPPKTDNQPPVEKRPKKKSKESKNSTTKDRKSKFSELFGDSSSLITPEDLGLATAHTPAAKYLPIFEDALDAIDVNVKELQKTHATPSEKKELPDTRIGKVGTTNVDNKEAVKTVDEVKPDSTVEVPMPAVEIPVTVEIPIPDRPTQELGSFNKQSTQTEEAMPACSNNMAALPSAELVSLENLVTEPRTQEKDVVKTVIISTGVQSQTVVDTVEPPINNNIVQWIKDIEKQKAQTVQKVPIRALATSTPYKTPFTNEEIEKPESCSSSDNRIVDKEVSVDDQHSVSTSMDAQPADAPDVRLFVRRRRKVKK